MSCGPTIWEDINFDSIALEDSMRPTFPTQYAMNIAAAVKLFLVAPATFAIPILIIRLTTGPKNPIIVYPTTGVAA